MATPAPAPGRPPPSAMAGPVAAVGLGPPAPGIGDTVEIARAGVEPAMTGVRAGAGRRVLRAGAGGRVLRAGAGGRVLRAGGARGAGPDRRPPRRRRRHDLEAPAFGPTPAHGRPQAGRRSPRHPHAFGDRRDPFPAFETLPAPIPLPGAMRAGHGGRRGLHPRRSVGQRPRRRRSLPRGPRARGAPRLPGAGIGIEADATRAPAPARAARRGLPVSGWGRAPRRGSRRSRARSCGRASPPRRISSAAGRGGTWCRRARRGARS